MTRTDFFRNVNDMWDLMDVCYDAGLYDVRADYRNEEDYDNYCEEYIRDLLCDHPWEDVVNWAYNWPTGYNWYNISDGDPRGVDDEDFDSLRDDVYRMLADMDWFEDDEEIMEAAWDQSDSPFEESEPAEPEEDDRPELEDGFDLFGLMDDSESIFQKSEVERKEREAKQDFGLFFAEATRLGTFTNVTVSGA